MDNVPLKVKEEWLRRGIAIWGSKVENTIRKNKFHAEQMRDAAASPTDRAFWEGKVSGLNYSLERWRDNCPVNTERPDDV